MAAERKEFGTFCKFLTFRSVQAIVQSRLGKKIATGCRVLSSPSDWFNLNVEELAEVQEVVRTSLAGAYPPYVPSVCIYISLQTVDGQSLALECWNISFDTDVCDSSVTVKTHVYHRFGTLLRSVVCASRMVPAYRCCARRQGPETFVLCYEVTSGQPQFHALGSDRKNLKLGTISCAYGTLELTLTYRTRMVIGSNSSTTGSMMFFDQGQQKGASTTKEPPQGTEEGWRVKRRDSSGGAGTPGLVDFQKCLVPLSAPRPVFGLSLGSGPECPGAAGAPTLSKPPSIPMIFAMGDENSAAACTASRESLCNTTFSTSPSSGDFPLASPLFHKMSFQMGGGGMPPNAPSQGYTRQPFVSGASPPYGGMQVDGADRTYYMTYPYPSQQGVLQPRASLGNIPHFFSSSGCGDHLIQQQQQQQRETILSLRRRTCSENWPAATAHPDQSTNVPVNQSINQSIIDQSSVSSSRRGSIARGSLPSSGSATSLPHGSLPKHQQQRTSSTTSFIPFSSSSHQALFFLGGQTPPSAGNSPSVGGITYPPGASVPSSMYPGAPYSPHQQQPRVVVAAKDNRQPMMDRRQRMSTPVFGSAAGQSGKISGLKSGSLDFGVDISSLPFAELLKLSSSYSAPCLALDTIKEVADKRSDNGNSSASEDSANDSSNNAQTPTPTPRSHELHQSSATRHSMYPSISESQLQSTLKAPTLLAGSASAVCFDTETAAAAAAETKSVGKKTHRRRAETLGNVVAEVEKDERDADNNSSSSSSDSDGFVLVDVNKPVFVGTDSYKAEVCQFVKDFRAAPLFLQSFDLPASFLPSTPRSLAPDPSRHSTDDETTPVPSSVQSMATTLKGGAVGGSPSAQGVAEESPVAPPPVNPEELLSEDPTAVLLAGLLPSALEEFQKRLSDFDRFVDQLQRGDEQDEDT